MLFAFFFFLLHSVFKILSEINSSLTPQRIQNPYSETWHTRAHIHTSQTRTRLAVHKGCLVEKLFLGGKQAMVYLDHWISNCLGTSGTDNPDEDVVFVTRDVFANGQGRI